MQARIHDRRMARAPEASALQSSRDFGMPPLAATSYRRDAQFLEDLRELLAEIGQSSKASPLAPVCSALAAQDDDALGEAADRVLAGTSNDSEAAAVPLLGAALQVYFTRLASTLETKDLEGVDVPTICPACASRPVASLVRLDPERPSLRYLCCSLCHTQWNLARITCSSCESDKGLQYFGLEGADGKPDRPAWRAEACDDCKGYLKIFYQEKDPHADPAADDLASLALDLLVDERGFARSGPNLLFHPGGG
ncbi:MAG: formate dehydrogenase accessory protein FdhE [Betaproteobacteria bacterium]|nr:formate dehydrogenase accessory protein FdhE [Betaproteobacteria bacterium]